MKNTILTTAILLFWAINSLFSNAPLLADNTSYKALFIAIDAYATGEWSNLESSVSDATALKTLLENKYGFSDVEMLTNKNATQGNILKKISELTKNAKETDNILIFFSGHGTVIDKEGYWIPTNAVDKTADKLIANTTVKEMIGKSKSKHILLFSDATFEGESFKSPSFFIPNDGTQNYYKKIDMLLSRQAITSGGDFPELDNLAKHSVFIKYLLKFLENNNAPTLDTGELYEFLKYPIFANSPNMPRFGHLQDTGHEGGQFVFRLTEGKQVELSPSVEAKPKAAAEKAKEEECNLSVVINEGKEIIFRDLTVAKLSARTDDEQATFQWYLGNAVIAGETKKVLSIKKSGKYKVVATSPSLCQSESIAIVTVDVPDLTGVEVFIEEGNNIEFTMKGQLTAKTFTKEAIEYEWKTSGITISKAPVLTVFRSGRYVINILYKGEIIASDFTNVVVYPRIYTTTEGDDAEGIAEKFYSDKNLVGLIYMANADLIEEGKSVLPGTKLEIPNKEAFKNKLSLSGVLKLAAADNFAPFSKQNSYNEGIVTDVVRTTFKKMEQESEIEFVQLSSLKSLAGGNGTYAAAFPVQKSEETIKTFYLSSSIYDIYNVFFSQSGANIDFSTPKKLKGKKVAVLKGYYIKELNDFEKSKYIEVRLCNSLEEAFSLLKNGKVDLVATERIAGYNVFLNGQFKNSDFEMVEQPIGQNSLHLAIPKINPIGKEIMASFNQNFNALKNDGEINKIIDKHIDNLQKKP